MANEAKSARGRKMLAALEESNKAELKTAIRKAINTGEQRAQLVEKRGAKMDKDVRTIINYKLSAEITKLRSETNASVEALALQSKEARAEMKKEMLYAIRSASQVAKADLNQAVLISRGTGWCAVSDALSTWARRSLDTVRSAVLMRSSY